MLMEMKIRREKGKEKDSRRVLRQNVNTNLKNGVCVGLRKKHKGKQQEAVDCNVGTHDEMEMF
jgi:hypothetical protein